MAPCSIFLRNFLPCTTTRFNLSSKDALVDINLLDMYIDSIVIIRRLYLYIIDIYQVCIVDIIAIISIKGN